MNDKSHAAAAAGTEAPPEIDLRQLLRLTDDTGMFQHALHQLPDPNHGYCIDDNCRALIAAVLDAELRGYDPQRLPLERHLMFVSYGLNPANGRFRNFMSYDRRWLEDYGSQDSHGRTIWSLGVTTSRAPTESIREIAQRVYLHGLPAAREFNHIRPWVYTLIGIDAYLDFEPAHDLSNELLAELSDRMWSLWEANAGNDWPWWEDMLTWGNAKLPHAAMLAGRRLDQPERVEAALRALRWGLDVQTAEAGHLSIIGNEGWMTRAGRRGRFDQQPIEAQAFVQACLAAARITGDTSWADHARRCFDWFTGRNDLGVALYHAQTGGCQDGLHPHGANKNQGAESTLAYLLSALELRLYEKERQG